MNPGYFSLVAPALKLQQISMFLHISARVWGPQYSRKAISPSDTTHWFCKMSDDLFKIIRHWSSEKLFINTLNEMSDDFFQMSDDPVKIIRHIVWWSTKTLWTLQSSCDPDMYTFMLCSPIGKVLHCRVVALWSWNSQHLVQNCSCDQARNQNVRQMFFNGWKINNFCKFSYLSLLLRASVLVLP